MFLGSPEDLARDLHRVEWRRVEAPSSMGAGSTVAVPIAIRNSSPHTWPSSGPTRVAIAYHWLSENGDTVTWEGRRTQLPADIAAGRDAETDVLVDAPQAVGRYILALDLVREKVAWFSQADEEQAHRVAVEVVVAAARPAAPQASIP